MDLRPITKHIVKGVPHGIFVERCSEAVLNTDCRAGQQKTGSMFVVYTGSPRDGSPSC